MYKTKEAFTLVELLVVISIIAILMGILVPALQSARAQGQSVVCRTHLRNLGVALTIYIEDNDGWLPAAEPRDKTDETSGDNWYMNQGFMAGMGVDPQFDDRGEIIGPPAGRSILTCPSHRHPNMTRDEAPMFPPQERPYALSYTMNGTLRLSSRGGSLGSYRRADEFKKPAETLALCDGNGYLSARSIVFYEACPEHNFEYRHRGSLNVLMLDGHTGAKSEQDIPMGRASRYEHFWSEKKN